jgi:hypothetical protein
MANETKAKRVRLQTPVFRVSFPNLFTPRTYGDNEPKYSVSAIVDKKLTGRDRELMVALKKAVEKCAIDKFGEAAFQKMRKLGQFKWPFRDGEEKDLDGYGPGKIFFTLSSKMAPGVIGRNKEPLKEEDVYAGCYARATVSPYEFDNKSKGVALGLNNLQKVGEGEAFSQRIAAEEDFDEVDDSVWVDDYVADMPDGAPEGADDDLFT